MSGEGLFFDTNALVQLLKGNAQLAALTREAASISISIITVLEFLSFSGLTQADKDLFRRFLGQVDVIELTRANQGLLDSILQIRQQKLLKLPDAIISASALHQNCHLVTADQRLAAAHSGPVIGFALM
jgi:predicted nucleic acid-binding protein